MNEIKIFCPATIANLSCGFDVLGVCLDHVGDEMIIRKTKNKGVKIKQIIGADLPLDPNKNVAGVAAQALINVLQPEFGFEIIMYKNIKAGSGIGSSAASAAGAVYGINALCGSPLTNKELIYYAMQGEALASGAAHADNVAPALLGGFAFIKSYDPLNIVHITSPNELYATIIHPQIELKTKDARSVLKHTVTLKQAIVQCGNLGGLLCGLYTDDYDLIGSSIHDEFVESKRALLIPNYAQLKQAALDSGALGAGISGAGPSVFALSRGENTAIEVAKAMIKVVEFADYQSEIHVCPINPNGIKVL